VEVSFTTETATNDGICFTESDLGGECDIAIGLICRGEDVCEGTNAASTSGRCYENCTESGECAKGTCTDRGDGFKYCAD
jgi:hypothetical protein